MIGVVVIALLFPAMAIVIAVKLRTMLVTGRAQFRSSIDLKDERPFGYWTTVAIAAFLFVVTAVFGGLCVVNLVATLLGYPF